MNPAFPACLFASLVIVAAVGDCLSFRIPNWLNLLIAILFVPAAAVAGLSISVMGLHLACGIAILIGGLLLHGFRLMGGGDAKLLAAGALWLGFGALAPFLMWTALAGGLLGVVLGVRILYLKHVRKVPFSTDIPYGMAIAAGAIIALPQSGWMPG